MKSTKSVTVTAALASGTAGLFLALMATAAPAGADPLAPVPPPPLLPDVTAQASGPVAGPLPVAAPLPADPAALPPDAAPAPPAEVPHLASPDALPPGSTMDPSVLAGESPNVSYLKDLWHAVQNQEISGKEALLLGVAQRGMNTPYPNQAPGPNVPISGVPDPALAPAAAPQGPAPAAPAPGVPLLPPAPGPLVPTP